MATNLTQVAERSINPSNNRCINCIPYLCIHEIDLKHTNFSKFRTTENRNKKAKDMATYHDNRSPYSNDDANIVSSCIK